MSVNPSLCECVCSYMCEVLGTLRQKLFLVTMGCQTFILKDTAGKYQWHSNCVVSIHQ